MVFLYRTTMLPWLRSLGEALCTAMFTLLHDVLSSHCAAAAHSNGIRGPHLPCIIGHHQQYQKVPFCFAYLSSKMLTFDWKGPALSRKSPEGKCLPAGRSCAENHVGSTTQGSFSIHLLNTRH